jgi:hypothetical protein
MKTLVALALLAAAALIAHDVKGTWKGQINRPDGTKEEDIVLQLAQYGDSVTGKVGTHLDELIPVQNVKLDGSKLTFEVAAHQATFTFTLVFDGDTATGGVIRTRNGQSEPSCPTKLKRSKD